MAKYPKSIVRVKTLEAKEVKEGYRSNQGHRKYYCPYCYDKEVKYGAKNPKADTEGKLYILEKDNHGFCVRCGTIVFTNWSIEDSYQRLADSIISSYDEEDIDINGLEDIDLSSFDSAADHEWSSKYLIKRNPALNLPVIKRFDLRAFSKMIGFKSFDGTFQKVERQGILVPLKHNGDIKSYQIRFINVDKKKRFHTMDGIKILYTVSEIPPLCEITIVEGWADLIGAMGLGFPNVVALLGETPSPFQFQQLKELCPLRVNLMLDDPQRNSKLARKLRKEVRTITKQKCWNLRLYKGWLDPEEYFVQSNFKQEYQEWA